jgi:hypothetical protein
MPPSTRRFYISRPRHGVIYVPGPARSSSRKLKARLTSITPARRQGRAEA